jgi:hypothetical protein
MKGTKDQENTMIVNIYASKINTPSQALVAHTCNPSYSGGREQEDHDLKPAWANSSQDPISKKPITKNGLIEWLKM